MTLTAVLGADFPPTPGAFWQPLIGDGPWAITRPAIVMVLTSIVLAIILVKTSSKLALVPGKFQYIVEAGYDFARTFVGRDTIGKKDFRPFIPLLVTQFLLILINNLCGIIPPVQFPTMSRIGFPIALTLITFIVYNAVGFKKHGFIGYFKSMVPSGLPKGMVPFIFLLELITYFVTRPVTLALRLFANMFAGHMLLLVMILGGELLLMNPNFGLKIAGVGSFAFSIVFTFFEILIEFLQAYVFVLLTASYIAGSLADEH